MANFDITKEQFERALPVGTCGDDSLFEFVHPFIKDAIYMVENSILGEVGKNFVGENEEASRNFAKLVVLKGFLACFHQLDLVLTPTGFGVVSNDTTAPASKQRVDDLKEQLTKSMLYTESLLVNMLCKVEGWGEQDVAKFAVNYYYDYLCFDIFHANATSAEWYEALNEIKEVDFELRAKISDEQMDEFLRMKRNGAHVPCHSLLFGICDFFIDGKNNLVKESVRSLINRMENAGGDNYKLYLESNAYKINHFKNYENTKQAPAFFFLG